MKTRHFLLGAIGLLVMASCSNDEVVSVQKDEIGYDVAVSTLTRAADSYCNANLPSDFKVWAKTSDSKLFIDGDLIKKDDNGWTDVTATRYWPANNLDFYAQKNGDQEFAFNNGAPSFENFEVADNVENQVDLMYSVLLNQSKTEKVQLNFRHALSQVCFWATNYMKSAEVIINSVSVGHLAKTGTFGFPDSNTDTNYENNHTDDPGEVTDPELNRGEWEIPENASYNTKYTVKPLKKFGSDGTTEPAILHPGYSPNTYEDLTGANDEHSRGFSQVLTLLPQQVNAWNPKTPGANTNDWNGAYFLLDLEINNVVGSGENTVRTLIYDGEVAIPVAIDWKPGYRYIYTFVFEEGSNGGYTPDPTNPQPILTSIKYNVTVDDFVPLSFPHQDVNIDYPYTYNTTLILHGYDDGYTSRSASVSSSTTPYLYTLEDEYVPRDTDGKKFLGWSTDSRASQPDADKLKGSPISVDMTILQTDLYAVWEAIEP